MNLCQRENRRNTFTSGGDRRPPWEKAPSRWVKCQCGGFKEKRSKRCIECCKRETKLPTPKQLDMIRTVCKFGDVKRAAMHLRISVKAGEWLMSELKRKVGMPGCSSLTLALWAVKHGIYSVCLVLMCSTIYARPFWKKPPPPPPSPNYQTNAQVWWPTVSNATVYSVNWLTNHALTFSTNYTIVGVTNGSNYTVSVQSGVNGSTFSSPSCSVSFVAGSGLTNSCPVIMTLTPLSTNLNTLMQ